MSACGCSHHNDAAQKADCNYVLFLSKDHLGEGAEELGKTLIAMALHTIAESGELPRYVLLMNSGVKLVAGSENEEAARWLQVMADNGTPVLSCGTCLNYYQLGEALHVGEKSTMPAIMEHLRHAEKVITL